MHHAVPRVAMSSCHAPFFPSPARRGGNHFRGTPIRSGLTWVIVSQKQLLHPFIPPRQPASLGAIPPVEINPRDAVGVAAGRVTTYTGAIAPRMSTGGGGASRTQTATRT